MYIQAARDNERKERKRRRCFQFKRAIVEAWCYFDLYVDIKYMRQYHMRLPRVRA
jgi:hypothetical protein